MSQAILVGGLVSIGEMLATFAGALSPQIFLVSIAVTISVTVVINNK